MKFPNYQPEQWRDNERAPVLSEMTSRRIALRPIIERSRKRRLMKRLFDDLSRFSRQLRKSVGL